MNRHLSIALAGLLASGLTLSFAADPLSAQPHGGSGPGAMGRGPAGPEPAQVSIDKTIAVNSVSVKVVNGSLDKPLGNVEITISGLATGPLTEISDATGSVSFTLPAGADKRYTVSAKAMGAEMNSETFRVRNDAGVSLVLTTTAIGPGRGGRPSSRMMSGRARPEQNDASGTLTIRAISGELEQSKFGGLTADIPTGALVHLVGMHSDGSMKVQTKKVLAEKEGRVVFDRLSRDNSIAYYALTTFVREGGIDRLMTPVLQLPPQIGSRMMFAGRANDSATPGYDDLTEFGGVSVATPDPGKVIVKLFAEASQSRLLEQTSAVELLEIGKSDASKSASTFPAPPNASQIVGQSGEMKLIPGTELGQVSFYAARPSVDSGIAGVSISVSPTVSAAADPEVKPTINEVAATGEKEAVPQAMTLVTDATGIVHFRELEADVEYIATASVHGKIVRSEKFVVRSDKALSKVFAFQWKDDSLLQAEFDGVAHGTDKVYIARVLAGGRTFLSLPFQMTAESGAAVGIYMYPELLFSLHGGGQLDDKNMWFQTQISIANPGVAPLAMEGSGMNIPLPKGFLGASVADEMAFQVGVLPEKGFLWRGAIPPGQKDFIASFALPVRDGKVIFDMALPYGLRGGRVVVDDVPGMELRTPGGAQVHAKQRPNGMKFLEMTNISIEPKQRLKFSIRGLPQASVWKWRAKIGAGILVLLLLLWAAFVIFFDNRSEKESDPVLVQLEATRENLLEQMVALETEYRHKRGDSKEKTYRKARDKLNNRLVSIYRKIDAHNSDDQIAN